MFPRLRFELGCGSGKLGARSGLGNFSLATRVEVLERILSL